MRVLIIARTYIVKVNQKKIEELARYSDVEIEVIVPQIWQEAIHAELIAEEPVNSNYLFRPYPTVFTGKGGRYLFRTLDLDLKRFKPDIIQVEEDTRGLTVFQAALYKKIWAPKAIFIPFTWANIETPLFKPLYCFERFTLSESAAVICGNSDAALNIKRKEFHRPVYVIPQLGIDMDVFQHRGGTQLRHELELDKNCFVFGFAGRMVQEKGVQVLIDAVARLRGNWALILIGNGPKREKIIEQAKVLGIAERVRLVNSMPHYELAEYYNVMDVLVSPSISSPLWKEQFGLIIAQAMSSGVPVIGSNCGETPNLIGEAGLIFPEGDSVALAAQLQRLHDDKALRSKLGQLGVERIKNHYSFKQIAEQTYNVWRDLYHGD